MASAFLYSIFGAVAGATGAYYVCAVYRFKRLERKCIKTCLPLVLYASIIFFLVCALAQLLFLLPPGVEGVISLLLLIALGIVSYRRILIRSLPKVYEASLQLQPILPQLEHQRIKALPNRRGGSQGKQ